MIDIHEHRRAAPSRTARSVRRQWISFVGGVTALVLCIGFFFAGPLVLSSYDRSHRESSTCTVESVDGISGRTSNRGVGGASALVRVQTKECGALDIREGVTTRNVDAKAAELTEGETYVFSVGAGSLRIEGLLGFFKQEPPIYDFRPAA